MSNQDYEQKKRECWKDFRTHVVCGTDNPKGWFNYAFDRAYALGKEKETISQAEIERSAETHADELRVSHSIPGALVPMLHDIAKYSYLQGAQDFIGKQEKDAETMICGWVARDDGERWHERELHLFTRNKPERRKLMGDWIGRPSMALDSNLFPDLTWDSDPIEVELTIKRKKNG